MYTITKKYHFYAAHRNHTLDNKCKNIHGHTYKVAVTFKVPDVLDNGATLIFQDIDDVIEPIIKSLDHSTIIGKTDKLLINADRELFGKKVILTYDVASVEFVCKNIFDLVRQVNTIGTYLYSVAIRETESSEIIYTIN